MGLRFLRGILGAARNAAPKITAPIVVPPLGSHQPRKAFLYRIFRAPVRICQNPRDETGQMRRHGVQCL